MPNFKAVLGDIMSCLRRQLHFVMRNDELPLRPCALAWEYSEEFLSRSSPRSQSRKDLF